MTGERFVPGDIIMYEAVKGRPFFGIVTASHDEDSVWVTFWYADARHWETGPMTQGNVYMHLIGQLPDFAEPDQYWPGALPV